jgi:peroxiredoxin Q/BCP
MLGDMRTLRVAVVVALLLPAGVARGAMLLPGADFPPWELRDDTGKQVSSRDLAGKTYLLWFYPMAMTPGCTAEGNALRDRHAQFQAAGVEVLGISFDPPERNAQFVAEQSFPFRLLSDDGTLAVAVGAADSSGQKTPRRVSYLVGPDGKVLRAYDEVKPATHAEQVLADVRQTGAK